MEHSVGVAEGPIQAPPTAETIPQALAPWTRALLGARRAVGPLTGRPDWRKNRSMASPSGNTRRCKPSCVRRCTSSKGTTAAPVGVAAGGRGGGSWGVRAAIGVKVKDSCASGKIKSKILLKI